MFVGLVLLCMFAIYVLMLRVGESVPGGQKGLENPLYVPVLWIIFQMTDFIYLYYDNRAILRNVPFSPTEGEIFWSFMIYCGLIVSMIFGISLGLKRAVGYNRISPRAFERVNQSQLIVPYCIALSIITIYFYFTVVYANFQGLGNVSALKSKTSGEFPLLSLFTWLSVLAYAYFFTTSTKRQATLMIYVGVAMFLTLGTGSRTFIFILAIYALQAFRRRNISISLKWVPIAFPVLMIFFTILRSIRAGSSGLGNFFDERGGVLSSLFGSDEVATAEAMTFGLNSLSQPFMYRWPGEGIVGLFLSPIPRGAVDWKPFSASSQFSQWLSPGLWESSRSQFTIGGLLESCMEFGIVGGAVYLFMIGVFIGTLIAYASRREDLRWFYFGSILVGLFLFLRTDMQTTAVFLLPLLLTVIAVRLLPARVQYRTRRKANPGRHKPPIPRLGVGRTRGR